MDIISYSRYETQKIVPSLILPATLILVSP